MAHSQIINMHDSLPPDDPAEQALPVSLEIADPDAPAGTNPDGSVTVDLGAPETLDKMPLDKVDFDANLAEHMDESDMTLLASDLMQDVDMDLLSRADWEKTYKDGVKLLGLTLEQRTEPWPGACGIVHPIMAEAVVRFQAEVITETFPAAGPVKTKILGSITPAKEEAAARVRDDLNNEITDVMTEYRAEHERMLWNLPIAGSALKKVYYDPTLGRQTSMFVAAEDFIVSYGASDLASCARYTHRMRKNPNDVKKLQVAGFYRDVKLDEPIEQSNDVQDAKDTISGVKPSIIGGQHELYEINVDLQLPGDEDPLGIARPYIVTLERSSQKVLSIYRNWNKDDEQRLKRQHFVHYTYIPGFGFYGFGLIHLVGGFAQGATSVLRQLVDAGTLANLPGGFKTRGLRILGDDQPHAPAEWRDVDVQSGVLKDNLMPLPYKEPSVVLASLLDKIVEEGRKFAAVAEMKVSDFDSNSPVGTTMALLERTLKVMSAVQARIYAAMKLEFKILKQLISDHGAEQYTYEPESGDASTRKADYKMVDVLPVADPNSATMSQRIVQWQAVMQLAAMAPQIYDLPQLHAQMLDILGVRNIEKLIPTFKDKMLPLDPVSENMAILNGKPVKAFLEQDHTSHIAVHQAAIQDPKMQQIIGQNPMAQQIQAAAMAHIMEHVAFQYRNDMEQMLGTQLPPPDQPLPPQIEVQLSGLVAIAAQKLLGKDTTEVQAQQAAEAAKDPVLQQQQAEVAVKQAEVDRKKQQDQAMNSYNDKKLELDKYQIDVMAGIKGAELGSKITSEHQNRSHQQAQLASNEKLAGVKVAAGVVQQHQQITSQEKVAQLQADAAAKARKPK